MRRKQRLMMATALTLTCALAGQLDLTAQEKSDSTDNIDLFRKRGKRIATQTFGILSSNLLEAVSRGGVSNALQTCSTKALSLTKSMAESHKVELRRVSHKARNPKNKANAAELDVLEEFRSALAKGRKPVPIVRRGKTGGATFFAPIVINNPLCLNCHGRPGVEIKEENLKLIKRLYPKDEATGFTFGELRGMWRIDFKPPVSADARGTKEPAAGSK